MAARRLPSTSTFTVPSGSFSSCRIVETVPTRKMSSGAGIVLGGVLLRDEQDLLVVAHDRFERADGLLAADEQRDDHVREHDDVAQRQHGQRLGGGWRRGLSARCESLMGPP